MLVVILGLDKKEALNAVKSDKAKRFIEKYYNDKSLKYTAPFPMKLITENFDNTELLNKYWEGILDLTDGAQRKYFQKYIGFKD